MKARGTPKGYVALVLGYVIIAAAVLSLFGTGVIRLSTGTGSTQTQPSTIFLYNESTIELSPTGTINVAHQFAISNTSVVQAAFSSTRGAEMYIVPLAGLFNYSKYYTFTTGNVTSDRIFVTLASGSYYFVIANPVQSTTNITITQDIEVVTLASV